MNDVSSQIARHLDGKDKCQVLVVYEDQFARARATTACDFLVQRFWADLEFEFYWWRMEYLEAPELGERAALNAADADILIFAINELPRQRNWFERWLAHRSERYGLLLQLTELPTGMSEIENSTAEFFREIAGRGMLDYLSASPQQQDSDLIPDSPESAGFRTAEVTSALDDILRNSPPPPSHYGLNE